ITALRDDYGEIIGYLLIGTDNSVRHQVELDLQSAMAAATKANHAKSDFLSSMSHELRTPLSAMLGFAQLMESGTPLPSTSQKRSIDQILKAGWYLLDLINEILALALDGTGIAHRSHDRMPDHDRAAGANARHQRHLSPVRKTVLCQSRSDAG